MPSIYRAQDKADLSLRLAFFDFDDPLAADSHLGGQAL